MTQNIAGAAIPGVTEGRGGKVLYPVTPTTIPGEGGGLLWSPAGRGDAMTWDDVMVAITASNVPLSIYTEQRAGDPGLTIPAGRYECKGSLITSENLGDDALDMIVCARGVLLRNLKLSGAVGLQGNNLRSFISDDGPLLDNDPSVPRSSPPIYIVREGAQYINNGTGPLVDIPAGMGVVLGALNGGGFSNGTLSGSFAHLSAGQVVILAASGLTPQFDTNTVTGDAGAGLVALDHSGNVPVPIAPALFPLFTGTVTNAPQTQSGCSGATAFRPGGLLGPTPSGCMYFDTTIGKPVWWTGPDSATPNIWVDSTGAPA